MLLLATSLVGLAAMANAQTYVTADETKNPPVGYTSGKINLANGEVGKFSLDLSAYSSANYGVWGSNPNGATWTRMLAVNLRKGTTGRFEDNWTQATYTALTSGVNQHTAPTLGVTDNNQYWCGQMNSGSAGLDMNINQPLEISFKADCQASNSCTSLTGADFYVTAWFYNVDSSWLTAAQWSWTQQWDQRACFGDAWQSAWSDTGDVGIDVAFRPTDGEGFTANLVTTVFAEESTSQAPQPIKLYSSQSVSANSAFPAISTWVGRDSASPSLGLYATVAMGTLDAAAGVKVMLCFHSNDNMNLWATYGNQEAMPQSFTTFCNLGCYPNADCTTNNVPSGGWDMDDQDVGTGDVWSHAFIVDGNGASAAPIPDLKIAYAYGHKPDAATAFGPSALLGLLALAAATLA